MLLVMLLHSIQHIAYGYSLDLIISPQSFLEGVVNASPLRRVAMLALCGLIAGLGWWALYRYGKPLVGIQTALHSPKPHMPIVSTLAHASLQIITIALGSPLGREVAPREVAATYAIWLANKAKLTVSETHTLLACAAGAGLAAVYNVPMGGILFTLEVLLRTLRWQAVIPAILISVIATAVSWMGLGHHIQYPLTTGSSHPLLIIWSILTIPFFGVMAYWFNRITTAARHKAPRHKYLILFCLLNFIFIGLLSIYFPELLGNGKAVVQIGFNNTIDTRLALVLLLLRIFITWGSLRAGAQGGLLTPSLANGALMAIILGNLFSLVWPGVSQTAYVVVGATAFLAAAQTMPLTAIVLIFEFTGVQYDFMIPLAIAVVGASGVCSLCRNKFAG